MKGAWSICNTKETALRKLEHITSQSCLKLNSFCPLIVLLASSEDFLISTCSGYSQWRSTPFDWWWVTPLHCHCSASTAAAPPRLLPERTHHCWECDRCWSWSRPPSLFHSRSSSLCFYRLPRRRPYSGVMEKWRREGRRRREGEEELKEAVLLSM